MWPILVALGLGAGVGIYELTKKPSGPTPPTNPTNPTLPASTLPGVLPSTTDVFKNAIDPNSLGYSLSANLTQAIAGQPILVTATAISPITKLNPVAAADTFQILQWLSTDRTKGVISWNPASGDAASTFSSLMNGALFIVGQSNTTHPTVDGHPLDPVYVDPNKSADDEHNIPATPAAPPIQPPPPVISPMTSIVNLAVVTGTSSGLNVHTGPSVQAPLVSPNDAFEGSTVWLYDKAFGPADADAPDGWACVRTPGGADGYASASYLHITGSLDTGIPYQSS